jgi:hypothetical protein
MKRLIANVFIALAAMFLVACGGVPLAPEAPTAQGLMVVTKPLDPKYQDLRYCGEPARDAVMHTIIRDPKVPSAFRKIHACPSTGLFTGACPRWAIDHVLPLDVGGCDAVSNMQWLPDWLKSCAGYCKDRWERKINCRSVAEGGTGCVNSVIEPPSKP